MVDDEGEQSSMFDYDREFARATIMFNEGRGLSLRDIQTLLDILNAAKQSSSELTFKTVAEYKAFVDKLLSEADDGWMQQLITIDHNDIPEMGTLSVSALFHYKDILKFTIGEFANSEYEDGFVLQAKVKTQDGRRVFTHPSNADAWIHLQNKLPKHAAIAALQLYSDKSLVNNKGRSVHPVKCTTVPK